MRMTARAGGFVVLAFAGVWLWVGASSLPMPWKAIVGTIGILALLAVALHVLRSPAPIGSSRRFDRGKFDRGKFAVAVAFEIVAANLVAWQLGRAGLLAYLWPSIGIIVALHFIGLWWATRDARYLALTLVMLAFNVAALFFGPGAAMLAISGLGSSASLAAAMVRR